MDPIDPLPDALRDVDGIFDRFHAAGHAPGVAWGVVAGGRLVHASGLGGLRDGESRPVDADSVFRIASMTKSFTAAAVLMLRDARRLSLDEPVATYVPDLAGLRGPTRDSPPVTVRHLLTHTAGFATDDPWGDRQQELDLDAFAALLRAGPSFAWAPGTRFEYSNLGYGILGRVITNVSGIEYRRFIRERLLAPLGMSASGYLAEDVPPERLAAGHVKRDGRFEPEPMDGYGALAAMGGLFTSVRDLARWVAFFTDADPPRDELEGDAPLSRASRREMGHGHATWPPEVTFDGPAVEPNVEAGAYGFGLFRIHDLGIGSVIGHSGGYPGFGSNMRWHPASGLGVVAFGNARYCAIGLAARDALRALVRSDALPVRRVRPSAATEEARRSVERLLEQWDDELAASLFAMNVELDEPIARRRAGVERLREVHGALRADETEPPRSDTPSHLAWWLNGERGRLRVEILLSPEPAPRVQALTLTSAPEPSAELRAAAARIVGRLGEVHPSWPEDVVLAATADGTAIRRALLGAAVRYGAARLGPVMSGDGARTAAWRVEAERGRFELRLGRDSGEGTITAASFIPERLRAPELDA